MSPTRDPRSLFIIVLALLATTVKLAIAYNTIGTNDAVFFYGFAKVLSEHGLEWTYAHSRYFNHPPLTAYFLRSIFVLTEQRWCQDLGIHFPLLLRLPGIMADFLVVLILLQMSKRDIRIPTWALALFAVEARRDPNRLDHLAESFERLTPLLTKCPFVKAHEDEMRKGWSNVRIHVGETYRRERDDPKALLYFDETLRREPGRDRAWLLKAMALSSLSRTAEARACLMKISERSRSLPEYAYWLSRMGEPRVR